MGKTQTHANQKITETSLTLGIKLVHVGHASLKIRSCILVFSTKSHTPTCSLLCHSCPHFKQKHYNKWQCCAVRTACCCPGVRPPLQWAHSVCTDIIISIVQGQWCLTPSKPSWPYSNNGNAKLQLCMQWITRPEGTMSVRKGQWGGGGGIDCIT